MKTISRAQHVALLAAWFAAAAAGAAGHEWQEQGVGPAPAMPMFSVSNKQDWHMGGLCVEFDARLEMMKRLTPCWSFPDWPYWMTYPFGERWKKTWARFGAIRPAGRYARLDVQSCDWSHRALVMRAENGAELCRLVISRVLPGVYIETAAPALELFAHNSADMAVPYFFAIPAGGEVRVFHRDDLDELNKALALEAAVEPVPWLLMWWGRKSHVKTSRWPEPPGDYKTAREHGFVPADCPLLLVFGGEGLKAVAPTAPTEKTGPREPASLLLEAAGDGLRLALLPLFGDYLPLVEETASWSAPAGLPEAAAAACGQWSGLLGHVPYAARESYSYNRAEDAVEVLTSFSYLPLRDEAAPKFAPLPPMLALARKWGFPVELEGTPVATSARTAIGPYEALEGAESFSYTVKGMDRYVKCGRRLGDGAHPAIQRLQSELARELEKVLATGHLAPWNPVLNGYKFAYGANLAQPSFAEPGEVHWFLSEALPLLDEPMRARVLKHMREEAEAYPPAECGYLNPADGARRERYIVPEYILALYEEAMRESNTYAVNHMLPEMEVYCLDRFRSACGLEAEPALAAAQQVMEPYLFALDWASLGWFQRPLGKSGENRYDGIGGVPEVNIHFAACAAMARLAEAAGDEESETMYRALLAKTAALRYAMAKYMLYIYDSGILNAPADPNWMSGMWGHRGLYTHDFKSPEDDLNQVVRLNEFGADVNTYLVHDNTPGLIQCWRLTPELALFMRDYLQPEIRKYAERVAECLPDWYRISGETFGSEHQPGRPEDAYYTFLARAWVLDEKPERLEYFLDVPALARGDMYYIHKLAETIKAYRGFKWTRNGGHTGD